jgi:hypothetical protein
MMSNNEYVINGALGPNRIKVSHDPERQEIMVESEKRLLEEDMRTVEEYLNLNMSLGKRWNHGYAMRQTGEYPFVVAWAYLEAQDCDWS